VKSALIIALCVLATLALLLMGLWLGAYAGISLCCVLLPDACGSAEPSICLVGLPLGGLAGLAAAAGVSAALWVIVPRIRSRRRSSAATIAAPVPDVDEAMQSVKGPDS
jgi:hypothetical protein